MNQTKRHRKLLHKANWVLIVSSLLCVGCDFSETNASESSLANAQNIHYRIVGRIDQDMVNRFRNFIENNRRPNLYVTITSGGGDTVASLELGDLMKGTNTHLVIQQYCMSDCAQMLIPSAKSVYVLPHSVVLFHWSGSDLILQPSAPPTLKDFLNKLKQKESEFYKLRGIDPVKMKLLRDQAEPLCTFERLNLPKDVMERYGTAYRYGGFTPTLDILRSLGINNISGYWPKNEKEFLQDAEGIGFKKSVNIKFITELRNFDTTTQSNLCPPTLAGLREVLSAEQ